jgi:hypothetical protein
VTPTSTAAAAVPEVPTASPAGGGPAPGGGGAPAGGRAGTITLPGTGTGDGGAGRAGIAALWAALGLVVLSGGGIGYGCWKRMRKS